MKTKIDAMGRVGIPKKIRTQLQWEAEDLLKLEVDSTAGSVALKKSEKTCLCCGGEENLVLLKNDLYLCFDCAKNKFS